MFKIIHKILATSNDSIPLIARVALGAVMVPHGLQKTVGAFGGYGFDATMNFFTGTMGIPWIFALAAILAEAVGSWALIAGGLGRIAAAGIAAVMAVAIVTVHGQFGILMNWSGNQPGEGFEYHLLAIALAAIVVVRGSGRWSIDGWLTRAFPATNARPLQTVVNQTRSAHS